ncbi:hypothetical protein PENNAL_c0136G03076 [Penicillium nalgiovense]|uniref:Uncharacterized protein n=1 Tax=Penicillium nalgiovense TaxID=60175 RepID=A0A1V6X2T1_PENNA|nr:hypothetical protein PENNAL_c0136G03076 [Penicillium nalgiovense]
MSPSQQPSELIYCTASVCVFPRDSANIRVAVNIDIAPEVPEDTAPPLVLCTKPLPTHDSWPRRIKPSSKESDEEGTG